ncbi:hypothetical protein [Pantoea sp.]|uniref:hypothetical protein n=1 Tax=Pantoea sp. TaxID=69393 RepID=UPI0028A78C6D|nr:hypothetical protein [Pantoea sp.]
MDFKSILIGIAILVLAIFLPTILNHLSGRRRAYRAAASPLLNKLLIEMSAIKNDSYPFQTIREDEIYSLYSFAGARKRKALSRAYDQYVEAHSIAKTSHWHDVQPPENVCFVSSFIVNNPDEVLKKMKRLEKELLR